MVNYDGKRSFRSNLEGIKRNYISFSFRVFNGAYNWDVLMKALDILKDQRYLDTNYDHRSPHKFDEAIAELEALQKSLQSRTCDRCYFDGVIIELEALQNRSCESCKYLKITNSEWGSNGCNHQDIYDHCDDGSYVIPNDFCCNRYEPKDK